MFYSTFIGMAGKPQSKAVVGDLTLTATAELVRLPYDVTKEVLVSADVVAPLVKASTSGSLLVFWYHVV